MKDLIVAGSFGDNDTAAGETRGSSRGAWGYLWPSKTATGAAHGHPRGARG
ncbi:hypothetical protein GQ55_5G188000 [Panicum hallii var. hallii]|uniref:Uncharacterized protein n=1 Tax=Panicum hallii var. hallii TaxID=1504633 RepID=A0A2T7DHV5_9POAL|nr:hypothetical protein GQ55_5G188000 [Panicum hallii var. hallii]